DRVRSADAWCGAALRFAAGARRRADAGGSSLLPRPQGRGHDAAQRGGCAGVEGAGQPLDTAATRQCGLRRRRDAYVPPPLLPPARLPNCPKSTAAISPLSSNSADTISLGSERDHRSSECFSRALCLSTTGTPKGSPPRAPFLSTNVQRGSSRRHGPRRRLWFLITF